MANIKADLNFTGVEIVNILFNKFQVLLKGPLM